MKVSRRFYSTLTEDILGMGGMEQTSQFSQFSHVHNITPHFEIVN